MIILDEEKMMENNAREEIIARYKDPSTLQQVTDSRYGDYQMYDKEPSAHVSSDRQEDSYSSKPIVIIGDR